MQVSFKKNEEANKVKISADKLLKHTFERETNFVMYIASHLYMVNRIKGLFVIFSSLIISYFATQGIIAFTNNVVIGFILFNMLFATVGSAIIYGVASVFDMAIVNRKQFVNSVIDEIEREASERIDDMEDRAMTDILAKASLIPGLEELDIATGFTDPKTGEQTIKKVASGKKDKKTTKN